MRGLFYAVQQQQQNTNSTKRIENTQNKKFQRRKTRFLITEEHEFHIERAYEGLRILTDKRPISERFILKFQNTEKDSKCSGKKEFVYREQNGIRFLRNDTEN